MFETNQPYYLNENNEKIIYPFGPPIFQTEAPEELIKKLIDSGRNLNKEKNDNNFNLAGNLKYGRSFSYNIDFIEQEKKFFLEKAKNFINMLEKTSGIKIEKKINIKDLWINFSKKHDFNPSHSHEGFISFVIYCNVPEEIFEIQADSNFQHAGQIIFEYGDDIGLKTKTNYKIKPYPGLMFMFPSKLRHFVPPYYSDSERISVSGNILIEKN